MHNREAVTALERDLRDIFGSRLRSLVAYGAHADEAAQTRGDKDHAAHTEHAPDQHTMAVVDGLSAADLQQCARHVSRWHQNGLATPLVLTAGELERSADVFPFEFGSMAADHLVVTGADPFDALRVDPADARRACEAQARSHLLHLREGYIETRGRGEDLAELIVRSARPFAALLSSVGRLQGLATPDLDAVGRHTHQILGVPGRIANDVLALAHVTEITADEATRIFPAYLGIVERLVAFVDGWTGS